MSTYDGLTQGLFSQRPSLSDRTMQERPEAPVVDSAHPCLLLLRRAKAATGCQPPLVIAHSLLGDHRGYGRLWNSALHQSDVYALKHRGLTGAEAFSLDAEGAMRMADEYAAALVAVFAKGPFDLMGASFGAVLAMHVWHAAKVVGGSPRRLVLIDPPPAVPSELPVPKMLTSLRTAAMGVLLLHLKVEMGASVWEQFPQLRTLPEHALAYFVAAQCLPEGASRDDLAVGAVRLRRLMLVYQQCRHAFHTFSASIKAVAPQSDGSPAVLMALSTGRWLTFREMFPGIKEDARDNYGQATILKLPGKHNEMVRRCIGNQDFKCTGAVERFLSDSFADAWWWAEHVPKAHTHTGQPQKAVPSAAGLRVDDLLPLLSTLTAPPAAQSDCEAAGLNNVEVAAALQGVARELLKPNTSADTPLMEAGLDSLGAVEFRSQLSSQLGGVKLPDTLVFDFPTMRQIESHTIGLLVASRTNAQSEHCGITRNTIEAGSAITVTATPSLLPADPQLAPEVAMPAGCNCAHSMERFFDPRHIRPAAWRTLCDEVPRKLASRGGYISAIALECGSVRFFAPAAQSAALIEDIQLLVADSLADDAGIPMTDPMLRDYKKPMLNILQIYPMEPGDNLQMVSSALSQLVAIHPMLRSVHASPAFWIRDCASYTLDEETLPYHDDSLAGGLVLLPLDLAVEVFRARLYSVQHEGPAFLGLSIHHIVLDGPSQQIVYTHMSQILAAERSGQPALITPYDEGKIVSDAIMYHVLSLSEESREMAPLLFNVELSFRHATVGAVCVESPLFRIPGETIAAATQIATSSGFTLNALLLGTLACVLRKHSGRDKFAISQTYLARRSDQMQAVGSFSTIKNMVFDFAANPSLISMCRHVLKETQQIMSRNGVVVGSSQVPPMSYELNDLRPLPMPAAVLMSQALGEIFFTVNQYIDGYCVIAMFDTGKYSSKGIETFVSEWMEMWVGGVNEPRPFTELLTV